MPELKNPEQQFERSQKSEKKKKEGPEDRIARYTSDRQRLLGVTGEVATEFEVDKPAILTDAISKLEDIANLGDAKLEDILDKVVEASNTQALPKVIKQELLSKMNTAFGLIKKRERLERGMKEPNAPLITREQNQALLESFNEKLEKLKSAV